MKVIATDVNDSDKKLARKLAQEEAHHLRGIDSYFYRSHLVYE